MKQKFLLIFCTVAILASLFGMQDAFGTEPATYTNCSGNICVTMVTSLVSGATGVNPNTTVNLNFFILDKSNNTYPACQSGSKQLYYAVLDANNNVVKGGSGASVDYSFVSGSAGTKNKYFATFYCWSQQVSDKASLNTIAATGQYWQSSLLDVTTRTAPDTGSKANGAVCGKSSECFSENCTNGICAPATTNIQDKDGPKTGPTVDCLDPVNAGNQNCLINPLPTPDLKTMFVLLVKWLFGLLGGMAVLFIIIGGYRMVLAQGNEEAYGQAKKTITWAVLGLVMAILSFSMVAIVQNILQANIK